MAPFAKIQGIDTVLKIKPFTHQFDATQDGILGLNA
jgi:hypothetical protein